MPKARSESCWTLWRPIPLATDTLDPGLIARIRGRLDTASPQETGAILASLRDEVLTRCRQDLLFWLTFVRTRDEADPEMPIKPFPVGLDYVQRLMRLLGSEQRLAIVKSRQMMVSWAACAYMTWHARFKPHQAVLYQTQNWPDAVKMVAMPGSGKDGGFAGRCQFLEAHLPPWMRVPVTYTEGRALYPNGSVIEALPGGADKIRGKTASVIVLDEMAFLEDAKGTYTAIAPLVQKGARLFCISTPNGAEGNTFYHIWTGTPMEAHAAA